MNSCRFSLNACILVSLSLTGVQTLRAQVAPQPESKIFAVPRSWFLTGFNAPVASPTRVDSASSLLAVATPLENSEPSEPSADNTSAAQSGFPSRSYDGPPDITLNDGKGSTNVPMDSWIYPALERLSALGLIPSQSAAIRPWTRQECLRQVKEVEESIDAYGLSDSVQQEGSRILSDLQKELERPEDGNGIVLESAYTRYGMIAGPALTDSFHFGQTWMNDFGRPLRQGGSEITGFSARGVYRRYFIYDRQELQQTSGTPAFSTAEGQFLNTLDNTPFGSPVLPGPFDPATPATSAYLRQRPLELYAGVAFKGNTLSFGKQELYWGPTTMGPWSFSSNAEPTYNLRLVATRPHPLPFFPNLGTYRFDFVFGKLSGHHYPARPYYNGAKVDFTFGKNFELSFTRWSILWGVGHPMTLGSLKHNIFSSNSTGSTFDYGDRDDPGDRKSDFDFRWHLPGLERYATIYADAYADDEPNPIDAPRRVAWAPGIYLARLPYLPHMDLRFEMASSEELSKDEGGTRFFINNQYRDGNTNKGFLLGNAIGRDARAFEGRTGYWITARSRVEAGYRQRKISDIFLPGGGTTSDAFLNASYGLSQEWSVQAFAQYERHLIPSIVTVAQHDESGWLQITWNPKLRVTR